MGGKRLAFLLAEEGTMPTRPAFVFGTIFLVFIAEPSSRGKPPAEDAKSLAASKPKRTDRYGDPLPPGVVARLGTERLTLANTSSEPTFSPDGRHLAAYDYPDQ